MSIICDECILRDRCTGVCGETDDSFDYFERTNDEQDYADSVAPSDDEYYGRE